MKKTMIFLMMSLNVSCAAIHDKFMSHHCVNGDFCAVYQHVGDFKNETTDCLVDNDRERATEIQTNRDSYEELCK